MTGTKYPAPLSSPATLTALTQWANGGNEPILLRYHVALGHSGGEPRSVTVKNQAEEMGFLWWRLEGGRPVRPGGRDVRPPTPTTAPPSR